ncbi:MAG: methionine synthase [Ruminococcus sp.]|nr:methionine synthase [Ruminococcus sp.]
MLSLTLTPVNRAEVLRYMGFGRETPDDAFLTRIDTCEKQLLQQVRPHFIYRVERLTRNTDAALSAGSLILQGQSIAEHLEGCTHVIFMAATLSIQADRLIAQAQTRDLTDALILEALANAGIEQICDKAEQIIREKFPEQYFTWRFSPGYGDLPLEIQGALLGLLDAPRKIGLTATETSILIPRKSVTALIGVSDSPLPKKRRGCIACTMRERCLYRNKGVHCSHVESASEE